MKVDEKRINYFYYLIWKSNKSVSKFFPARKIL